MHPKYLKVYTLNKLKVIFIWLVVGIIAISASSILAGTVKAKSEQALGELKSKEDTNTALKAKLNIANAALIAWEDVIKKEHSDRSGLKIKQAQKIIEQLKQTYRINKFNVTLTNPEKRSDIVSKYVDIAYSSIVLNFTAYTDTDTLLFIDSLSQQLPGHVIVKTIDVTGIDAVDKSVLLNLSGGQDPNIVMAKVELVWQDMQDRIKIADVNKNQPVKK